MVNFIFKLIFKFFKNKFFLFIPFFNNLFDFEFDSKSIKTIFAINYNRIIINSNHNYNSLLFIAIILT